jgi:phenylacetate-CoA ligase
MSELGLDGIKIEKFYYGGERLYAADEDEVRSRFGTKVIRAPGYGTVDTWYIGYQCEHAPLGVFHAHDDQCYIEIVDEDEGGRACAPGEVGMMLATPFPRLLTPVVRYRVGDLAKWVGANCECGRKTPLFELLGRGDDVLRIGYDSIDYNFLQERISTFSHQHKTPLSGVIQMQKLREDGKDRLVIRVEAEVPTEAHTAVAHQLAEMILEVRPSLREFVKKGSVLPLIVEILPNGSLKRNSRTGKLVRVIDSV